MTDVVITLLIDFTQLALPVATFLACLIAVYIALAWLLWRLRSRG
jgi:hypothetical protein